MHRISWELKNVYDYADIQMGSSIIINITQKITDLLLKRGCIMSMSVVHNITAMNANRMLNIVGGKKAKSTEKLASGYRVNRAADDAAGLAISEKMRRQIKGLTRGTQNTQDGISMCQIADGALSEVGEMMHRLTELSVQSANGTNDEQDRFAIQQEVFALLNEIDRVSEATTFNEKNIFFTKSIEETDDESGSSAFGVARSELLTGTYRTVTEDITLSNGQIISAKDANAVIAMLSGTVICMEANKIMENGDTVFHMQDYIDSKLSVLHKDIRSTYDYCDSSNFEKYMEEGMEKLNNHPTSHQYDTAYNSFWTACRTAGNQSWAEQGGGYDLNYVAASSAAAMMQVSYVYRYDRNDSKKAAANFAGAAWHAMDDAGITGSKTLQYINNMSPSKYTYPGELMGNGDDAVYAYLSLFEIPDEEEEDEDGKNHFWIQSGAESGDGIWLEFGMMDTEILGINGLDVRTEIGSQVAIERVKNGLGVLSSIRSEIGAQQNRLEHTIRHQDNTVENTTAAESRIRDTDMAKEMVAFSNHNILEQAGSTMLAQANQSKQNILSLLQ